MNYFSSNIAYLRKERGLVQQDMTAELGVKRNTWSNWENDISQPSIDELVKIAHFFGVGLTELLTTDLTKGYKTIKDGGRKHDKKGSAPGVLNEDVAAYNATTDKKQLLQKMQALEAEIQDIRQSHNAMMTDLRKIIAHLKLK